MAVCVSFKIFSKLITRPSRKSRRCR